MGPEIIPVAFFAYVGFLQWLRHQRRAMVHRERLAAIEKVASLPPDAEPQRSWLTALEWPSDAASSPGSPEAERRRHWNLQRLLLLGGLVWLSVGVGAFVTLSAVIAGASPAAADVPRGIEWIGLAPAMIGLSHLAVYAAGRRREP